MKNTKTLIHRIEIDYREITTKDSEGKEFIPAKMTIHYSIFKELGSENSGSIEIPLPPDLQSQLESIVKSGIKRLAE